MFRVIELVGIIVCMDDDDDDCGCAGAGVFVSGVVSVGLALSVGDSLASSGVVVVDEDGGGG